MDPLARNGSVRILHCSTNGNVEMLVVRGNQTTGVGVGWGKGWKGKHPTNIMGRKTIGTSIQKSCFLGIWEFPCSKSRRVHPPQLVGGSGSGRDEHRGQHSCGQVQRVRIFSAQNIICHFLISSIVFNITCSRIIQIHKREPYWQSGHTVYPHTFIYGKANSFQLTT